MQTVRILKKEVHVKKANFDMEGMFYEVNNENSKLPRYNGLKNKGCTSEI